MAAEAIRGEAEIALCDAEQQACCYRRSFAVAQLNPRAVDERERFFRHATSSDFEIIVEQSGEQRIDVHLVRIGEGAHRLSDLLVLEPAR